MLLSPNVTLAHRPKDKDTVKSAAEKATGRYKEISGRESKIDFEDSLNDDSAGGIIGSSTQGRIKVDNTLGERLKLLEEKVSRVNWVGSGGVGRADGQMLPELRTDLFGKNENRKFYTVSHIIFGRVYRLINSKHGLV